jgi:hypothetical protein
MSVKLKRTFGFFLLFVGLLVVVFSEKIVFPGLERLIGIERIVGGGNVVYEPDGSYVFTNPGAMIRWVASVAGIGAGIILIGGFILFRTRKEEQVKPRRLAE